jgi:hypothetical protein
LQNDNQSTEIFTDIDQYNDYQGTNDNNQGIDGNGGWGSNYTQTDITVYPSNFNAGWGIFNGWGNPYFNNGFGWNNLLRRIRMEQCFYGNGFDGAIHSDLDMGIWILASKDLAMEASDGITYYGYNNFYGKDITETTLQCRSKRFINTK